MNRVSTGEIGVGQRLMRNSGAKRKASPITTSITAVTSTAVRKPGESGRPAILSIPVGGVISDCMFADDIVFPPFAWLN